jgi:parallel beta-helix repeat protein
LHLSAAARGRILSCEFKKNSHGIVIDGDTEITVQGNQCVGNEMSGITCRGAPVIRRNHCSFNQFGILAADGAPTLQENVCEENDTGLSILDGAVGSVQ